MLPSDTHNFIGRVFDLSVVELYFEDYRELSKYPDCVYVYRVSSALSLMTQRIESLNMVGDLLWPKNVPADFKNFPVSRHQWLNVSIDVFLMRYISVVDCGIVLANEVFECGLELRECTLDKLKKAKIVKEVTDIINDMIIDQGTLRKERNSRFHHGTERLFGSNFEEFKIGSLFEHRGVVLNRINGDPLPVNCYFEEGLDELRRDFNVSMPGLVRRLDSFYNLLALEFEKRFKPKFRAGPFGAGAFKSQT